MLSEEIIELNKTIVTLDKDIHNTDNGDSMRENIKRILDILHEHSHSHNVPREYLHSGRPIHDILFVGPLTRTEIPLVVLDKLISVGFDVNCYYGTKTCLDIAIVKHHYDAVRLLVKRGAKCRSVAPLVALALQRRVPLDLFELFVTSQNMNAFYSYPHRKLPLHTALFCGHTAYALPLINLGASVNQHDGFHKLPIEYFVDNCADTLDIELFIRLLPSRFSGAYTY